MSRSRRGLVDWGLAVGLAVLAELQLRAYADCCGGRALTAAGFALSLVGTLPLVLRRRYPVTVLLVAGGGAVAQLLLRSPITDFGTFGVLTAFYTVSAESPRRVALSIVAATPAGILASQLLGPPLHLHDLMVVYVEFAAAWLLGDNARYRRRHLADMEDRAARIERARIAGELHDVVAQGLSVISLQAGAARSVLDAAPDQVRQCLVSIEAVSREAWSEMRRFLDDAGGVDDGPTAGPGLGQLADLIRRFEQTGLSVDLVVSGDERPLARAADLCAYRVVQESLTNALRHAGRVQATVSIGYGRRDVEVEVANERGPAAAAPQAAGRRHGLAGLRRRVRLAGGELSVEQRPDRFTVRARLPAGASR